MANGYSKDFKNGVSGFTAGFVSVITLYPVDLLKTRLQAHSHGYKGAWHGCGTILRTEGLTGLYRGVFPSLFGSSVAWGVYFFLYGLIKSQAELEKFGDDNKTLHFMALSSLCAFMAGTLTQVMTNPLWVIKTNSQLTAERSVAEIMRSIYAQRGLRGFWSGFAPSMFGIFQGAIQFATYETLKRELPGTGFLVADTLVATTLSKTLSTSLTYPYQIFRTRAQSLQTEKLSLREIGSNVWRAHGLRGFYFGLPACLTRILPQTCVTFVTWEVMKRFLNAEPGPSATVADAAPKAATITVPVPRPLRVQKEL